MRVKDAVGRFGEEVAVRYLRQQGLEVVARNWRCDIGEIDLVALDGETLVVCEVKTRSGAGFGGPLEAVDHAKAVRLRRLGMRFAAEYAGVGRPSRAFRIDVVGVVRHRRAGVVVEHVRAAC